MYIVRPELFSDPPFQRIVIGSENSADLEEETGEAEIELQPTPEPDDNEDDPADEDSQDAGGEAGAASFAIQPGNWLLTTQFVDISKVDPLDDSFTINRNGVGDFETGAVCVSEAAAQAPAGIAFPFPAGMGCTVSSFTMSGGNYSSTMSCNFPQYGGRRPVEASGNYSNIGLDIRARVTVPAEVVVGEFEEAPEIVMHYRMSGNYGGPC